MYGNNRPPYMRELSYRSIESKSVARAPSEHGREAGRGSARRARAKERERVRSRGTGDVKDTLTWFDRTREPRQRSRCVAARAIRRPTGSVLARERAVGERA